MKVSALNVSFGKQPILKCKVKEKETGEECDSTLYKMDINNSDDYKEIIYSKNTRAIKSDVKHKRDNYSYYIIKNDETDEVLSCAQTSRKYISSYTPKAEENKAFDPKEEDKTIVGSATIIEELSQNNKYENGAFPILAWILKNAELRNDIKVSSSFRTSEFPLNEVNFEETKFDNWTLNNNMYSDVINNISDKHDIKYYA